MKARIYIDFWNLVLNWKDTAKKLGHTERVDIPWKDIPSLVVPKLGPGFKYMGTNIYCSIDPNSTKDRNLKGWLNNYLNGLPGFKVIVKDRRPAFPVQCNHCHEKVTICPHCNKTMSRTVEKGIDTTLVTDMIQQGIDDLYSAAIIITEDSDFVPAVEFLVNKGKQIFHLYFKNKSMQLRNACWGHYYIEDVEGMLPRPQVAPQVPPA